MNLWQVAPVLLFALLVRAEKKIELQDIENDNLNSEKESDDGPEAREEEESVPLEYLKQGFGRFFQAPAEERDGQYVHQYSVSEAPERASATPKPQYGPPQIAQPAMVGYISNVPMQFYLVPQYYNEQQAPISQHGGQYQPNNFGQSSGYQSAPEPSHNYVEVPTYVSPTNKPYIQHYTPPVTYVYPQPSIAPVQATVAPVVTYQMPVLQYSTAVLAQQPSKDYYQNSQYTPPSALNDVEDNEIDDRTQYATQTEAPYHKPDQDFPRHYNSRTPYREEYRNAPSELPPPSPLLLKPAPSHLSHLPKALPIYRPISKPVYSAPAPLTPTPIEAYAQKRRPTSLLDSYIPSSLQVEYLKRGFAKDPLVLYDALSSGRFPPIIPRHYERGFLPNQMYHTAAGGVTFGHHKRSPKGEKVPRK